jgi:hypothetical protein
MAELLRIMKSTNASIYGFAPLHCALRTSAGPHAPFKNVVDFVVPANSSSSLISLFVNLGYRTILVTSSVYQRVPVRKHVVLHHRGLDATVTVSEMLGYKQLSDFLLDMGLSAMMSVIKPNRVMFAFPKLIGHRIAFASPYKTWGVDQDLIGKGFKLVTSVSQLRGFGEVGNVCDTLKITNETGYGRILDGSSKASIMRDFPSLPWTTDLLDLPCDKALYGDGKDGVDEHPILSWPDSGDETS